MGKLVAPPALPAPPVNRRATTVQPQTLLQHLPHHRNPRLPRPLHLRPHPHPRAAKLAPLGEKNECGRRNVDTCLNIILVIVVVVGLLVTLERLGDIHAIQNLPGGTGGLDDDQLESH